MNHSDDKGWNYPFETLPEWREKEIFHLWEHPGSDTACVIYHETELRGMSDWTGAIALLKNKAEPKLLFAEIGYDTPDRGPAYSEKWKRCSPSRSKWTGRPGGLFLNCMIIRAGGKNGG